MGEVSLGGTRILVVDDSPPMRMLLRDILQSAGAEVLEADSGALALEIADAEPLDLVLLDVSMPQMNGLEVCDALRVMTRTARLPVVIVTGMTDMRHHADALERGADDFVAKPLHPGVILARVSNLVRCNRAEIENLRLVRELDRYVSSPAIEQARKRTPAASIRASILFSDMRNFTTASVREAPDVLFQGVNVVMGHQAEIVKAAGGYVDTFAGDGMLAVFSSEWGSHIERAIEAGMRIVAWARNFTGVSIWTPLPIGVGIATGDVMRGSLGSEDRQEFTVIGNTVNLACRICGLAGDHEVVLCEETYQSLERAAVERRVKLKGMPEAQSLWVLQP